MANRYLEGDYAPLDREYTLTDLEVTGALPDYLDGRYLRNGPNPVGEIDPALYHWFIGDGMVHGIRIRDGRAEWYRNRWVRGPQTAATLGENPPAGRFPISGIGANTNVIGHAGKTLALIEGGCHLCRAHRRAGHGRRLRFRRNTDRGLHRPPEARPANR
jgi:carotenoid cleavage dioxygenase